ncbi:hypothetical protein D3C87_1878560 [compost metagenome]
MQAGPNHVVFKRSDTEHLAHGRHAFHLLARQFCGVRFVIPFQLRNLSHELGCHIHGNGQLAFKRFHAAIHFLRQRLCLASCSRGIFQEQRQVEVGFAFAVFPAQRRNRNNRFAF